jgi:hypothetical protein
MAGSNFGQDTNYTWQMFLDAFLNPTRGCWDNTLKQTKTAFFT